MAACRQLRPLSGNISRVNGPGDSDDERPLRLEDLPGWTPELVARFEATPGWTPEASAGIVEGHRRAQDARRERPWVEVWEDVSDDSSRSFWIV